MNEHAPVKTPQNIVDNVAISQQQYIDMHQHSIQDPTNFWKEQSKRITWFKEPTRIKNTSFDGTPSIKWYEDGVLNACYNCIDRHLEENGDKVAYIFEQDEPGQAQKITYQELHDKVCQFANVLKEHGVTKGERVVIYMPMIPEATYAMLACARIGAIHSVVFGGFSPRALCSRVEDAKAQFIITADEGKRGGGRVALKENVDTALRECTDVKQVFVVRHTEAEISWSELRDIDIKQEMEEADTSCECAEMSAEDPLFILYTSGSTGTPKGVLHTTGGYMVYTSLTHATVFDLKGNDVYWCTADVGWITGHSYIVYGPLANGCTSVIYEGIPTYPEADRMWKIVDEHKVSLFYTAPTAIRALMRHGNEMLESTSRSSLRILGTVGEPINPEAWRWYFEKVGHSQCAIVDTWWQTETGGFMLTPLPGFESVKPGLAMTPFFGVRPVLVDTDNNEIHGAGEGALCINDSWPGQMRTVWGDEKRFKETYFSDYPGRYFTGDGAERDEDDHIKIIGRMDDVINVSGHRFGTAEIESALSTHQAVAEAAIIGVDHAITGKALFAYVTLRPDINGNDELKQELIELVRHEIGPIAKIETIQWADDLPKTRSGKIMRRILRKIAENRFDDLGDISTLADPSVVEALIDTRKKAA